MTRMIERWFPCHEVSDASKGGWGSGNSEASLFPWFARRPLAQAKAAVVCSLLAWPSDPKERLRLQALVRRSLIGRGDKSAGYDEAHDELLDELARQYPDGASLLDPFSGRGMIPVEGARLGVTAWGFDNSPVATLGGSLLIDYPMRDWSLEPDLPFENYVANPLAERLLHDVEFLIQLTGDRLEQALDEFYPTVNGRRPWGYLWAATLPCQECGRRFPMVGSLLLRNALAKSGDDGQSFRLVPGAATDELSVEIHPGGPTGSPTLVTPPGQSKHSSKGKLAICPFCAHAHAKSLCERLAQAGLSEDALLVVADLDDKLGKVFRLPSQIELDAIGLARTTLENEPPFIGGLPARPTERIPDGNTWTIQPAVFGAKSYGDLCNDRQTLSLVRLARTIDAIGAELLQGGVSSEYAAALTAYLSAGLARKLRRSTRGCALQVRIDPKSNRVGVHDIFGSSESSISFSWDYFESGPGHGPGTWRSVAGDTVPVLRNQMSRRPGRSAKAERGSAVSLPFPDGFFSAVVTDPPYDSMIDYADASDLFFVWMKRALISTHPWFALTSDRHDLQDKTDEIIVKKGGAGVGDHRTEAFYDAMLTRSFAEAKRVVTEDGVVTIVFGHGDPDVWHRLLGAVKAAGLVLTGSWPAQTEKGGTAGSANIVTTLTLACRPAALDRPAGRVADVDAEVRAEIVQRIPIWETAGLALTDQLMASAGPAMEVVGRYSEVLDKLGNPVALDRYLPLARRFVEEAADIRIDTLPLETFDARTRFALFWIRLYGRGIAAGSEARWQRLASDLTEDETSGLLVKGGKGVRFAYSGESRTFAGAESAVIDVALEVASAGKSLAGVVEVLACTGRTEDPFVWAAMAELSRVLPEADRDCEVWTWVVRNRGAIAGASRNVEALQAREAQQRETASRQTTLFEGDF